MGKKKKTFLISFILFVIISVISTIWFYNHPLWTRGRNLLYLSILAGLTFSLAMILPLIFSVYSGIKTIETENKKKIFWKSPLIGFIIGFIEVAIIWLFIFLMCSLSTSPFGGGCNGIMPFGMFNLSIEPHKYLPFLLSITIISFIISLSLYFLYKKRG